MATQSRAMTVNDVIDSRPVSPMLTTTRAAVSPSGTRPRRPETRDGPGPAHRVSGSPWGLRASVTTKVPSGTPRTTSSGRESGGAASTARAPRTEESRTGSGTSARPVSSRTTASTATP